MRGFHRKDGAFRGDHGHPLDLDLKGLTDQGEFEGYASTFGNMDQAGEICVAGCFAESLARRPASKVKMLLHHDTRRICGVWKEMAEDGRGLRVKGQLLLTTQDGRETYELMRAGALDAMSIGFRTLKDEIDRGSGVRKLITLDLFEVSIVTFPMNTRAGISTVKAEEVPQFTVEQWRGMEAALRDEGLSRADAVKAVSGFKKYLLRDAEGPNDGARDEQPTADTETVLALRRLAAAFRG